MKQVLGALICLFISVSAYGESKNLVEDYLELRSKVERIESDGPIGGFGESKQYPDYLLIWKLGDSADKASWEFIRFMVEGAEGEKNFQITYYLSTQIVPGSKVVRRFIGPDQTGWQNVTADYPSGKVIGHQGVSKPRMHPTLYKIIESWGLIEDL